MQGDASATFFLGDRFDGEFTFTCRFPAHALISRQAGAAGFDGDLVGDDEADIKSGKISYNAPIAKAAMGKFVGTIITVPTPNGDVEYEIIKVIY